MKTVVLLLGFMLLNDNVDVATVNELAAQYKRASSEKERMNICIDAIDRGVVSSGVSVTVFDAIFGTRLVDQIPALGEPLEKGGVFFASQPKRVSDDIQMPVMGWYCAVEFDARGIIHTYHLSNLHK